MNDLVKSKKDLKLMEVNPVFFKKCLDSFKFLISDFSFDKAKIQTLGRECSVCFLKGKTIVKIIYELGVLPQLYLVNKSGNVIDASTIIIKWNHYMRRENFPIHFRIQDIINTKYKSIKEYVEAISQVWDKNKESAMLEVEFCLNFEGIELRNVIAQLI